MDWQEAFSGKCFISDLGSEQSVESDSGSTLLSRYAAWAPIGSKNHRIVEISDDLQTLMEKYAIPQDRVCILIRT